MVGLASCLTLVFVAYGVAVGNPYLFMWAGIYAVSRVWLVPFFKGGLLYTARQMSSEHAPRVSTWGTTFFVVVVVVVLLAIGAGPSFSLVLSSNPLDHLGEAVSINALLAAFMILYGVTVLITHRHPFKMVLGVLFMEAGILLSLVHMVPLLLAVGQVGFLFKFAGSIFVILWINRLVVAQLKITDTAQLSELKR
jgi:hydrogenase-4 membrane subunit HyfE